MLGRLSYRAFVGISICILIGCSDQANERIKIFYDPPESELKEKVIYGDDDRKDIFESESRWRDIAKSTVALIRASKLTGTAGGVNISSDSLANQMGLCAGEPFAAQPAAAFCSGSLVGEDLVMTAGHCIRSTTDCSSTKFVFDYAVKNGPQDFPRHADNKDVYGCAEILRREEQSTGFDYAIIRLDRKVSGRTPLRIRRQGKLAIGDLLTVVGHPSGLPTKIASGGAVRAVTSSHYVTTLDTYGGNSGSAVFNTVSGVIEGILVRGENDYVPQGGCYVSNRCSASGCRGEDVTVVSAVADLVPESSSTTSTTTTTPPTTVPPTTSTTTTIPDHERVSFRATPQVPIPDKNAKGIESTVVANQGVHGRFVKVYVDISHTYVGDLQLTLTDPLGRKFVLQKNKMGRTRDLRGTYGDELVADTNLQLLSTVSEPGMWRLKVADTVRRDTGTLKEWILKFE